MRDQNRPCPPNAEFNKWICTWESGSIPWLTQAWYNTSGRDDYELTEPQCLYRCDYPNGQVTFELAYPGVSLKGNPCIGTFTGTGS